MLTQMPIVDPARIGMIGFSRGGMVHIHGPERGYAARTHAIKAAVTVGASPICSCGHKDTPEIVRSVYLPLLGGAPPPRPDLFAARSAVYWPGANHHAAPAAARRG